MHLTYLWNLIAKLVEGESRLVVAGGGERKEKMRRYKGYKVSVL